jgi:hypothetical protein
MALAFPHHNTSQHGGSTGPLALTTPDSTMGTPNSAKRPSCTVLHMKTYENINDESMI